MIGFLGRVDRIDPVGVESEPLLDHAHLVVRRLVCPDRVLRAVLQGVVRGRALEGAYALMLRADEPVHLHVLARDVVNGGIVALLEPDRVPGVGDDLAVELHPDAHARRVRRDAMVRILLVSGAAVGFHGISFQTLAVPPLTIHGVPKRSTSIPKASTQKVFCKGMVTLPPLARASNTRFASATFGYISDTENPFIPS